MLDHPAIAPGDPLFGRVWHEYAEMPGLLLTRAQARRMWGLDEQHCTRLLASLVRDGVLYQREDGMYARRSLEAAPQPPPGCADGQVRPLLDT